MDSSFHHLLLLTLFPTWFILKRCPYWFYLNLSIIPSMGLLTFSSFFVIFCHFFYSIFLLYQVFSKETVFLPTGKAPYHHALLLLLWSTHNDLHRHIIHHTTSLLLRHHRRTLHLLLLLLLPLKMLLLLLLLCLLLTSRRLDLTRFRHLWRHGDQRMSLWRKMMHAVRVSSRRTATRCHGHWTRVKARSRAVGAGAEHFGQGGFRLRSHQRRGRLLTHEQLVGVHHNVASRTPWYKPP